MASLFTKLRSQPQHTRTGITFVLALIATIIVGGGFFFISGDRSKEVVAKAPSPLKVFGQTIKSTFEQNPLPNSAKFFNPNISSTTSPVSSSVMIINGTQADFDETQSFETESINQ